MLPVQRGCQPVSPTPGASVRRRNQFGLPIRHSQFDCALTSRSSIRGEIAQWRTRGPAISPARHRNLIALSHTGGPRQRGRQRGDHSLPMKPKYSIPQGSFLWLPRFSNISAGECRECGSAGCSAGAAWLGHRVIVRLAVTDNGPELT